MGTINTDERVIITDGLRYLTILLIHLQGFASIKTACLVTKTKDDDTPLTL